MFKDRRDAGQRLARALETYRNKHAQVLAIPRGGVEVGYQVAQYLAAGFSIIISRKLPFPDEPEAGFGAVAEDGSTFINPQAARWVDQETIARIIEQQKREIKRRVDVLRRGLPLPAIENQVVILVDDGIAMGSTMRVSISLCQNRKAEKVIVAVPVTGRQVEIEIGRLVDEIVVLEKPRFFHAVAQVYKNWYDVSDEEVIQLMDQWEKRKRST
jgi:predicted phosphoribosyltransferase